MKKFYEIVVKLRRPIILFFVVSVVFCVIAHQFVGVNYDITDYLPDDAPSTIAISTMKEEFTEGIPNARVMIRDVSIPQALEYKKKIEDVDGVLGVNWLDDAVDVTTPLSMLEAKTVETYYRNNTALYTLTIDNEKVVPAVTEVREIIGEENSIAGNAVNTADGATSTVSEANMITVLAVIFVLFVLVMSTDSWLEPIIILLGLGVAVILNMGTNLVFGTVSFVTNSAGNVLQLAVSLDYCVFVMHRFEECLKKNPKHPNKAMVEALTKSTPSVISSGITTVIGFLALILMRFKIGPDVGMALAKGVLISLVVTFVFMPAVILATHKLVAKTRHKHFMPKFGKFGEMVSHITVPMVGAFAVLIVPAFLAGGSNSYYYGSSHIFSPESRVGRDTAAIREVFGNGDTYAILVPTGKTAVEAELSSELRALPEVTSIISYTDTVGSSIPTSYLDERTLARLDSGNYRRMVVSVGVPLEGDETFALIKRIREICQHYYPDQYYLAGNSISTYDLKETITADMSVVNMVAIGAVLVVLLVSMKSIAIPLALILTIETAIQLNLSIPYFTDETIFYVCYLIISSIQLGATVDYAILMTDRYKENRLAKLKRRKAVAKTLADVVPSILVSGSVLTVVGFLLGILSSNLMLSQLGILIGRGAVFSLVIVVLVLPGILYLLDRFIVKKKKGKKKYVKAKA